MSSAPMTHQIYIGNFMKTLWLSTIITFFCFIIVYPVAHLLATLPLGTSTFL